MKLEILDTLTLPSYIKHWNTENWNTILDKSGNLYPDHIAFGIKEQHKAAAVIAAALSETVAEIKALHYFYAEALDRLMGMIRQHTASYGYTNFTYQLTVSEAEAELLQKLMQKNSWPMPSAQIRRYKISRGKVAFSAKAAKGATKGTFYPFFDTTEKQRSSLAMELPENSPFFQLENIAPEYCAAYVLEERIEGYFLCTRNHDGLCLELMQFPKEEAEKGALILAAAELLETSDEPFVYINVRTEFGEKIVQRFFGKQILDRQVILTNKEEYHGNL